MKEPEAIPFDLIAPCGMNCRFCWGYMREKNKCPGCRIIHSPESKKSKYRKTCKIKNCRQIESGKLNHCSPQCDKFPCTRLKQLDKRYKTKYGMSMIENLLVIEEFGIEYFTRNEKVKWRCSQCGEMLCIHKTECLSCGYIKDRNI
jgi:Protein of unknown function (DUF3795)